VARSPRTTALARLDALVASREGAADALSRLDARIADAAVHAVDVGVTQRELAHHMGMSAARVSQIVYAARMRHNETPVR